MSYSTALTTAASRELTDHLVRADGQEDLCFALWRPSRGSQRVTALVGGPPILPRPGERHIHGNASFEGAYFARALAVATENDAGLAFLHSHPGGRGWQEASGDDIDAEQGHAAQAQAATGLPLLGLTLATGDGGWTARFWEKTAPRTYARRDCENVRVVGDRLSLTFDDRQRRPPAFRPELTRTVSAWGTMIQADLARLRVGVVGAGSVGALVAEALARTGIEHLRLIDFDTIERVNLDRLLHASARDVLLGRSKVEGLARHLRRSATAADPIIDALEFSVVEPDGYGAALDCDVLFSCVDRPWPRYVMNLIAYAHLIPVVDGGILVGVSPRGTLRGADWRAHVAAPGRRCLECAGQYDPGLVQAEREGLFENPSYIKGLPSDHPIRRNENVFAFSLGCAALELSQFLSMVVGPGRVADYGGQTYHLVTGGLDRDLTDCRPKCPFANQLIAQGDRSGFVPTGRHEAAAGARVARRAYRKRIPVRLLRHADDLAARAVG